MSQQDPSSIQPTVRVMRLYKPGLHINHVVPFLTFNQEIDKAKSDFTISPYLILPDSFGDIYIGECFSAYISIVNGVKNVPFGDVTISVRLQTANVAFDLFDIKGNEEITFTKILNPVDTIDMIVRHPLNEIGTHTMRVSIAYTDTRTNEPKTLRKFYRFNVLSALTIETKCFILAKKCMIQCKINNASKNSLFITELKFDSFIENLNATRLSDISNSNKKKVSNKNTNIFDFPDDNLYHFLSPNESIAETFILTHPDNNFEFKSGRSIGKIIANWSSNTGENGFVIGDEIQPFFLNSINNSRINPNDELSLKINIISCPEESYVAKPFTVVIEISNLETFPLSLQMQSKVSLEDPSGLIITDLTSSLLGIVEIGGSITTSFTACSLGAGLNDLKSLVISDLISGKDYFVGSLCKIFIRETSTH